MHGNAFGERLYIEGACRAVEVSYEEDELPLVCCFLWIIEGAEGVAVAFSIVDRQMLDCG